MEALGHPTLAERIRQTGSDPAAGYRFVVYGDQRALADGEWQGMIQSVSAWLKEGTDPPLLFVLDTGDIVESGRHSDQFAMLREILRPIQPLPYLLAAGNHELANEQRSEARQNLNAFLPLPPGFADLQSYHWEQSVGALRLVALDSNVLVYRRPAESEAEHATRAAAELAWLEKQLADDSPDQHTILVLHHPLIQTSKKHRESARDLWSTQVEGRRFMDWLLDRGVDLIVCGHTHSYELFRIERTDGKGLWHLNLSGRPRDSFLWFGAGARRVHDIQGKEIEELEDDGFEGIDAFDIQQVEAMTEDERNQLAIMTVSETGALRMQLVYFDRDRPYDAQMGSERALLPAVER